MVPLRFRERPDAIGERERLREVGERKDALEASNPLALDDAPLGNFAQELGDLGVARRWRIRTTGHAPLTSQPAHD